MPWITLVQQAGTTSTVSGPAALSTYRRASESLHPAQAEVHFRIYSSLGISGMVSNSCRWFNGSVSAKSDRGSIIIFKSSPLVKKVSEVTPALCREEFLSASATFTPPAPGFKPPLFQHGMWGGRTNPSRVRCQISSCIAPPDLSDQKPSLFFFRAAHYGGMLPQNHNIF